MSPEFLKALDMIEKIVDLVERISNTKNQVICDVLHGLLEGLVKNLQVAPAPVTPKVQ